jgi:hypothetical protein
MTLGPDFFIVGAPKCGTTSLNAYLGLHPQIYMAKKEQHFFGSDLATFWPQPSEEQYHASFADGQGETLRGEGSGWYLLSTCAAVEIQAYNPNARIVAMLRNPLDMLPSLHSQFLYDEFEDIASFSGALAAEADRRRGERVPVKARSDNRRLLYREVVRFAEQLERYFDVFGRDSVHVVLFDDLAREPADVYRDVLEFLGADTAFTPPFGVLNPQKRLRSKMLQELVRQIGDPSSRIRRVGTRLMPIHAVRSAMLRHGVPALTRVNTSFATRAPLDSAVRAVLAEQLAEDIERLADLLGRSLEHWYAGDRVHVERDVALVSGQGAAADRG